MLHSFIAAFSLGPPLSPPSSAAEANGRREEASAVERERSRLPEVEVGRQEERRWRTSDRRIAVNDIAFFAHFCPNRRRARARPARRCTGERGREGSLGIRISSAFHVTQEDDHEGERGRRWRRRRELYECYVEEMRRRGRKGRPDGRTDGVHTERDSLRVASMMREGKGRGYPSHPRPACPIAARRNKKEADNSNFEMVLKVS